VYPTEVPDGESAVPCRILIADDHGPLRKTLKRVLEAHPGWEVCGEATTGLEAVQKAGELSPDVIILDLSMPVMGGLRAASEILAASPGMPILLFTNHAYPALTADAQKAGIRKVVSKVGEQIVSAVEAVLDKRLQSALGTIQPDIQAKQDASKGTIEQQANEAPET
jgi:DNA-binding NarL/FixJ family response regulator